MSDPGPGRGLPAVFHPPFTASCAGLLAACMTQGLAGLPPVSGHLLSLPVVLHCAGGWLVVPVLGYVLEHMPRHVLGRHVSEHMPEHVMRHMSKHVTEYVLKHVTKHVLRHIPDKHVLEHMSRHVPKHVLNPLAHAVLMT